ncbi:MAG: hypothetical protein QNJ46_12035 [Leptolyngbyaceae cyanobacterium MO_188.B28]|nr:hypothetical protein [Leptolyngbyaceae cyanobacterium MO_188.B28]
MAFFRSFIAPLLIVLIFAVAMLAVSARIFLPSDMMAPAPIEEMDIPSQPSKVSAAPTDEIAALSITGSAYLPTATV